MLQNIRGKSKQESSIPSELMDFICKFSISFGKKHFSKKKFLHFCLFFFSNKTLRIIQQIFFFPTTHQYNQHHHRRHYCPLLFSLSRHRQRLITPDINGFNFICWIIFSYFNWLTQNNRLSLTSKLTLIRAYTPAVLFIVIWERI